MKINFEKYYNRVADQYDTFYGKFLKPGIQMAVEMMRLESRQTLLEVGIGTGITLEYLPRDIQITGVDISDAMLGQAQKKIDDGKYTNVKLVNMSAQDIKYDDNTFDRVFAPSVLSVVPDPEKAMSEMLRVLKPDGMLCVITHVCGDTPFYVAVDKFWDPITRKLGGFRMNLPHSVIENAPGSIVFQKRPTMKKLNFNFVYILRKFPVKH